MPLPDELRVLLARADRDAKAGLFALAIPVYLDVAARLEAANDSLKAIQVYKQVLKLAPDRADIALRVANLYRKLGLHAEADAVLDKLSPSPTSN